MAGQKYIFKGVTKTINGHHIKAGFCAKPMDMGNASPFAKLLVDLKFVF
jgi:hypothetical protein